VINSFLGLAVKNKKIHMDNHIGFKFFFLAKLKNKYIWNVLSEIKCGV